MTDTPTSSLGDVPLPDEYSTLEKIRNIPNEHLKTKPLVNVIGFIKDYQPPFKTGGTDFKCSIGIMDYSDRGMKVDIFEKIENNMPPMPNVGELVIIRNVKAQIHRGVVGLIKHTLTEFRFLAPEKLPKKASAESNAPWRWHPLSKGRSPTAAEVKYVLWAINHVDEIDLPSRQEFGEKVIQAMKPNKDKFSLLKDVKPDRYYDILGEVIRLYEASGTLQVYLSDYTYNTKFYNYEWGAGMDDEKGREGDEYGYLGSKQKSTKEWPGPYGRMTLQLTLFDEHAHWMRENIAENTWVLLRNVQIKYGKIGGILEGYMRGDGGKMNVSIVEHVEGNERYTEALKRKKLCEEKTKKAQQDLLNKDAGLGNKRKQDGKEPSRTNSKKRRDERRAAVQKEAAAKDAKRMDRLNLNENIRCNNPDEQIVSLSEILDPRALIKNGEGQYTPSPFTCMKYRANVRVVDFFPPKIEDFAVGRRPSEYNILSDYSGGEDTDREEDMRVFKSGKGFANSTWEWRFALRVEDADSKRSKERLWLIVDNQAAQGLLSLEKDATNLRGDPELLFQVKEKLFKLWGDLEEKKSEVLREQSKGKKNLPQASLGSEFPASSPPRQAGEMPDADSDAENEPPQPKSSKKNSSSSVLTERDANISMSQIVASNGEKAEARLEIKNKAFTCCIRQYGVKVDEDDPAKANAGDGKRWQRVFGLFETYIL